MPPIGASAPSRIASRMRCDMNHAALRVIPKGAVKLVANMPFLDDGQSAIALQPDVQRDVASLEDGAHGHAERLAALVALVEADAGALALHLGDALNAAAMRADRAFRPQAAFDESISRFLVVEVLGGKTRFLHDRSPCPSYKQSRLGMARTILGIYS